LGQVSIIIAESLCGVVEDIINLNTKKGVLKELPYLF